MNKEEVDELYHLLRKASNDMSMGTNPDPITGLTPAEEGSRILGLTRHLLGGGDYPALVQFLQMYGEKYLIEPVANYVLLWGKRPERIVELGAGLGWLTRGVSRILKVDRTLTIDKRAWSLTDVVLDLETDYGVKKLLALLKEGDFIFMCDFLHCIEDPNQFLTMLNKWNLVVVEYCPQREDYGLSYSAQLSRYGARAFSVDEMEALAPGRPKHLMEIEPYRIYLFEAGVMYD